MTKRKPDGAKQDRGFYYGIATDFVSAVRSVFSMMATLVVATITPSIIGKFGGFNSQSAWTTTVLLYGIIAFVCIMITFLKYIDSLKLIPRTNKGWRMK